MERNRAALQQCLKFGLILSRPTSPSRRFAPQDEVGRAKDAPQHKGVGHLEGWGRPGEGRSSVPLCFELGPYVHYAKKSAAWRG